MDELVGLGLTHLARMTHFNFLLNFSSSKPQIGKDTNDAHFHEMVRKKFRERDLMRLLKENLKQIAGIEPEMRKKEEDDRGVEDGEWSKKWSWEMDKEEGLEEEEETSVN